VKPSVRLSEVATPPRDQVVKCIENRALSLQGHTRSISLEKLKVQKYGTGGHYSHHFDWMGGRAEMDRVSSFMVYVEANCTGGGTEFPRLRSTAMVDGVINGCESSECVDGMGVTFQPRKLNAVFWENIAENREGFQETYHAGLPVTSGSKIGLNIWSWA
jgi:prolyl 4-hydroxylase